MDFGGKTDFVVFGVRKTIYFSVILISTLLLLSPISATSSFSTMQAYEPKKLGKLALIIFIDGLDYSVFEDANTPNLDQLASNGYLFHSESILPSSTTAGVTAIATGAYPNASGVVHTYAYDAEEYHSSLPDEEPVRYYFDDMLNATTIFESLFDKGVHTYLFSAKSKLEVMLGKSGSIENYIYFNWRDYFANDPHETTVSLSEREVMIEAMTNKTLDELGRAIQFIERGEDVFMFLAYPEPDWSGHAFGPQSTTFKGIVEFIDEQVGRIVSFIKQESLWDNSLIITVADHGYAEADPAMNILDPNDLNHIPGLTVQHIISPTAGNSLYLYLKDLNEIQDAVNQLWEYPWVAGLWTRETVSGANGTLKDIGLNTKYAGDIFIDIKPPYYASAYVNYGAHGGFAARNIPIIVSGGAIKTDVKIDYYTQLHIAPTLAKFFNAPLPDKCFYKTVKIEFKPYAKVEAKVSPRITELGEEVEIQANYSIIGSVTGAKVIIDLVSQNGTLLTHEELPVNETEGSTTLSITASELGIMSIYVYIVDANGKPLGGTKLQLLVAQVEKPPRNWGAIIGGIALSIILLIVMFLPLTYKRLLSLIRKE